MHRDGLLGRSHKKEREGNAGINGKKPITFSHHLHHHFH